MNADLPERITIVTIKWGNRYPSQLVNQLYFSSLEFGFGIIDFICYTDDSSGLHHQINIKPLPQINLPDSLLWTFWRKISLYNPELGLAGPCLYLDLDVVIVGKLSALFHNWKKEPRMIETFAGPKTKKKKIHDRANSSAVLFEGSTCGDVYQKLIEDPISASNRYPGDQGFTHECLEPRVSFFPNSTCVSFKKHCIPKFPLNFIQRPKPPSASSIVVFHGKPDPQEARLGYKTMKLRHWTRSASWIPNYDIPAS